MASLFNPWVLLSIAIAFAISNGYSYVRGGVNKQNAIKAGQLDATRRLVKSSIEKANTTRAADVAGEKKTAEAIQAKQIRAMETRHALDIDIERKRAEAAELAAANPTCPIRSCDLDERSYGVLLDAIRRANTGDRAPAGGKPDTQVPRDPPAPRRGRSNGEAVVLRLDPALRRMP